MRSPNDIIASETEAQRLLDGGDFAVEEKSFPAMLVAGFRMKGKYSEVGEGFGRLGKAVGR